MIKNIAFQEITELRNKIIEAGITVTEIISKQYNFEFTITKNKVKLKILYYFGKKGLKKVLQGNQETEIYSLVNSLITGANYEKINRFKEPDNYIGTDESGKGDFFGPLVVAAVFVDSETKKELLKVGVKDSKELSDLQINRIASKIKEIVKNNFEINSLEPIEYNKMYTSVGNLNTMLNKLHSEVIEKLLQKVQTGNVIVDKFAAVKLEVEKKNIGISFDKITRAEQFVGVAAASILARAELNDWFEKNKIDDFCLLKGASTNLEKQAMEIKKYFGLEIFEKIAKLHFKTLKKITKNDYT